MRGIEDTRQRWDSLFRDNHTPSDLRAALRSDQGDKLCNEGLRSICWKAFLLFDNLDRTQWPQKISESRGAYDALKAHFLKYINHPDDLESTVDPLADDEESPWQTLRHDEQMRADILQDVDRCLQENFFFREPSTKEKMIDVLFIYSKLNPDLGYRQGMHELLAPILWVVDKDAIETKSSEGISSTEGDDDFLLQLLHAGFVEHDSFSLFCSVMQSTRSYYEHNRHRSANGQMDVVPIVNQCQHLHNELLMTTDLELADHLQALEILPQIFLTRWMRLLFGREFPFQDVLVVWDVLFAEGLRPELIDFVCVAMLLRIRWQLLDADSSTALTILLRYPSPHPHEPQTFVRDAVYLEQNPTPDRGAFIISKYSGKPPDSSKRLGQSHVRSFSGLRSHLRGDLWDASEGNSPSRSPVNNSPKGLEALFQDVSEGIQRRTESWGVAKAVRGAVNEAKKNMQTIQAEHYPRSRYDDAASVHTSGAPYNHDSDAVVRLKTKIDALEARNQMLAKTLSQALNDIRSRMMKAEGVDTTTADTVKQALTKVQSVQTCLENLSSPMTSGGRTPNAPTDADSPAVSQSGGEKPEDETRSSNNKSPAVAAELPTKSPTSPVGNDFKSRSRPHIPSSMPLRHASRPSLADSEFSWMLGGNRHLSSFVSPASVPPEQTRHGDTKGKPNNLFGNGDEEQRRTDADLDGLALRSLRGPKGGE
ncbi:Ypt/Rab-specific GTPase-activating protein [Aspergillus steynii IBT 23096]|uniref:Ypt/Rab-specific GTPase-activating protein n=1 Tax=Aspergillus steynii IBT 23096 TaxID=1392250 RepID=A0A2I2FYG8_9EURO|nr:Ypt/Rab-specific GTPase-activating protein [Aspergillus steynii IBT 23096]PLB45679.1 Ypt/Rab-specific GTPase-activating protein [Aspergillus steynii IBT 23096]